jgi:hypothetical protein
MTNKVKNYLEALNLRDGDTCRTDCPVCRSRNTFTATKDGGTYVYNCFKLSCKLTGAISTDMTAAEIKARIQSNKDSKPKELQPLVYPEYVVDPRPEHRLLHNFIEKWGLQSEGIMYDVKDRRAVFPILYKGRMLDAVGRALDGAIPKWYRYSGNAEFFSKRRSPDANTAVVVEDVISAIKVAHYAPSAVGFAILGTSLSVAIMQHLGEYDRVVIALDPDAAHKTLQYKREVELWTGLPTKALRLDDDIKYGLESDIVRLKEMVL